MVGLREWGRCTREGAVILGGNVAEMDWRASTAYFTHEIDEDRSSRFGIELSERGKVELYRRLEERRERVVGLLHTHPGRWVDLSEVDRRNGISTRIGVWSIVVPNFASGRSWPVRRLGIHVLTETGWARVSPRRAPSVLVLT